MNSVWNYLINTFSSSQEAKGRLIDISVYPVKSCGAFHPKSWEIDEKGLYLDRHWMIVDDNGHFIGQESFPEMSLISPLNAKDECIQISSPNCANNITISSDSDESVLEVALFGEGVEARKVGKWADDWFSEAIGTSCHLVSLIKSRSAIPNTLKADISFSSESQFLCLFNTTFRHLEHMIMEEKGKPIYIESFRGNVVIDGLCNDPFEEQNWIGRILKIGNQTFHVHNGCDRCRMININQTTGKKTGEPFLTLCKIYKGESKTPFGIFLIHDPDLSVKPFVLNVGDPVCLV